MLRGARLVTAQETEEGRRWAESKIKTLSGGDPIAARFMRGDYFEFQPQFKLLIAGNHKPGLRTVDEAMRRRFHLIPFTVTIPPEKRDPELDSKLQAEAGGILQWAIDGCLSWQDHGLAPPAAVREATETYLEGQDAIGAWLAECCDRRNPNACTNRTALYNSFKAWASDAGEFVPSAARFFDSLGLRGFEQTTYAGKRMFRAISLINNDY